MKNKICLILALSFAFAPAAMADGARVGEMSSLNQYQGRALDCDAAGNPKSDLASSQKSTDKRLRADSTADGAE